MDFDLPVGYKEYRCEVEAFLDEAWVRSPGGGVADQRGRVRSFRRAATARGYLYRAFPRRYGGSEQPADTLRAQIIREAFERAKAPMELPGNGVSMLAPTLLECGAEWQKEMFIEKTLTGEYSWAQGYSEPGAGSDLASLRTRGELRDGEWVINGQKIWTSFAHQCTHMFALVRTEPDAGKRAGISYLLLKLDQPGITIRRIHQMSGQSEFCEVFLEDARTPANWIVGDRGEGWDVSKSTLKHERNSIGGARTARLFESLVRLARSVDLNGGPAIKDPQIRARIAQIEGYVEAQNCAGAYQLSKAVAGEAAGLLTLLNKLAATTIGLDVANVASDILGDHALQMPSTEGSARRNPEQWLNQVFGSLALAIAGGTSNIQRNLIAERGLGLPREPQEVQ